MPRLCQSCSSEIEAKDVYCPYCGAQQPTQGNPMIGSVIYHWPLVASAVGIAALGFCLLSLIVAVLLGN
jgi:hypothetical protein